MPEITPMHDQREIPKSTHLTGFLLPMVGAIAVFLLYSTTFMTFGGHPDDRSPKWAIHIRPTESLVAGNETTFQIEYEYVGYGPVPSERPVYALQLSDRDQLVDLSGKDSVRIRPHSEGQLRFAVLGSDITGSDVSFEVLPAVVAANNSAAYIGLTLDPAPAVRLGDSWSGRVRLRLVNLTNRLALTSLTEDLTLELGVAGGTITPSSTVLIPKGKSQPDDDPRFETSTALSNKIWISSSKPYIARDTNPLLVSCEASPLAFRPIASPPRVASDGMTATEIKIALIRREDGVQTPLRAGKALLSFSHDHSGATVEPREVVFAKGESVKSVAMKSPVAGTATVTIWAEGYPVEPEKIEIEFVFPFVAMIVALVMGGGVAAFASFKKYGTKTVLKRVVLGAIASTGLWLLAYLYAPTGGSQLLQVRGLVSIPGAILLGIVAGWGGTKILDLIVRRVLPSAT